MLVSPIVVPDPVYVVCSWRVQVPFEITACNVIIHFWSDVVPAGGIIAIVIILYAYVDHIPGSSCVLNFASDS